MKTNTMKIFNLIIINLSFVLCDCKGDIEPDFATDVKVTIRDENVEPIEGAEVKLLFSHFDEKKNITHVLTTDDKGTVRTSEKVVTSLLLNAGKPGFYPLRYERVLIRMDVDWQKIKRHELSLVMRRIKQPAPLFAKKFSAIIPAYDRPIGFDFEAGDWVAPHGQGKSPDMLMEFNRKLVGYMDGEKYEDFLTSIEKRHRDKPHVKKSYFDSLEKSFGKLDRSNYRQAINLKAGEWDGELSITFPHSQEGISNAKKDYCHYSSLALPHLAYEDGYTKSFILKTDNYTTENTPPDPAYFVRTRVILDDKGEIISSNYAKITSPIHFDPRGRIEFTYVFNPTPNDRNLEFDTNRNLFGELDLEQRVTAP